MRRILLGMGVVPITHDKDKDNYNGSKRRGSNCKEDDDDNKNAVRKGKSLSSYLSCNRLRVNLPPGKQIRPQDHGAIQPQAV